MNEPSTGTPTDPVWWFVVLALLAWAATLTLLAVVWPAVRALVRRTQQRRELARWKADAGLPTPGGLR